VFPDYVWEIRHVVEQPPWLAVHLHDTGTRHRPFLGAPGDLSAVETDEFDMYRMAGGRIAEVWGTADNARLRLVSEPRRRVSRRGTASPRPTA
jgi:predicted ester cyclase